MATTNWDQLRESHEIAFLRADVCIASPESYSLDEKRRICEEMDANTAAIDAAMREDFESLPDFAKARLLDMLGLRGLLSANGGSESYSISIRFPIRLQRRRSKQPNEHDNEAACHDASGLVVFGKERFSKARS